MPTWLPLSRTRHSTFACANTMNVTAQQVRIQIVSTKQLQSHPIAIVQLYQVWQHEDDLFSVCVEHTGVGHQNGKHFPSLIHHS